MIVRMKSYEELKPYFINEFYDSLNIKWSKFQCPDGVQSYPISILGKEFECNIDTIGRNSLAWRMCNGSLYRIEFEHGYELHEYLSVELPKELFTI